MASATRPRSSKWTGGSKRWAISALVALMFSVGGWVAITASQPAEVPEPTYPDTITIHTGTGDHVFTVEWAITPEERGIGLMFRQRMDEDHGMVFDFRVEREVSFWMRNTYISLDMVFIFADGTVHRVAEGTVPLTDTGVPSGAPVRYVLEVIAGTVDRIGLQPGDLIDLH